MKRLGLYSIQLERKVQDVWIGAYWKQDRYALHIWICLVPMLPLHVVVMIF
jgi:hypothetical protein